jgi:RNA polymerase sigma factor (sigma-70 family)
MLDETIKNYLVAISKFPRLTREEEYKLGEIIQNKDSTQSEKESAVDKIVTANLKLVVSYAKRRTKDPSVSLMDVINAGNLGLMYAAYKFNPVEFGQASFATYAENYIHKYMNELLYSQVVKAPSNMINLRYKYNKLKEKFGDSLTKEMVKDKLSINEKTYSNLQMACVSKFSLNQIISEDSESSELITMIPDETSSNQINNNMLVEDIGHMMIGVEKCLTEIEKEVIYSIYNIGGNKKTLNELGLQFNYTGENIRRIKNKALKKLKNYLKEKSIVEY